MKERAAQYTTVTSPFELRIENRGSGGKLLRIVAEHRTRALVTIDGDTCTIDDDLTPDEAMIVIGDLALEVVRLQKADQGKIR